MERTKIRTKEDQLKTTSWEELFVLAGHWKSDLDFYRDEINFLNNLVGKYFTRLTRAEGRPRVREISNHLFRLDSQQRALVAAVVKHMSDLSFLMENAMRQKENWFFREHMELEQGIAGFVKEFRKVKKEIFSVTEPVIRIEKFHYILTP